MIELYHAHISTCSQKVRLCLAEKELHWVGHALDFSKAEQLAPDYLKLNPNGVVPTLVHDGKPVIDSSVICEYLDEVAPGSGTHLMPSDPLGKAKVRAWLRYIEEVPTAAIRIPSFNRLFLKQWQSLDDTMRTAYVGATPLRKDHYRQFGTAGFSNDKVTASMERLRQTMERIEAATVRPPWLAGDDLSLADICVLPTVVRMSDLGLEDVWVDLKHAQGWYARMQARPSFAKAFYPEAHVSVASPVSTERRAGGASK